MKDNDKMDTGLEPEENGGAPAGEEMQLDDERRVKGMSPSRLVIKRFMRNRLAIVGAAILVFMFLFSFVGGWISPYGETQRFYVEEYITMDYAGVSENTNFRYTIADGAQFGSMAQAAFVLASSGEDALFESGGEPYYFTRVNDDTYMINAAVAVASAILDTELSPLEGYAVSDDLQAAFEQAVEAGETSFILDGEPYTYTYERRAYTLYGFQPIAIASYWVYDMAAQTYEADYEFVLGAEMAIAAGGDSFTAGGFTYRLEAAEDTYSVWLEDELYANISRFIVQPIDTGVFIPIEFKTAVNQAIAEGETSFTFVDGDGEEVEYTILRRDRQYTIKHESSTLLYDTYASPSAEHPLGTDVNGMDVLTRLMYGGRVSLLIGMVSVLLMVILGIIMGSVSGYFGKWADMVVMRIVDVFDSIPLIPLVLILGMLMDAYQVDAQTRIFLLILIMGFKYWTTAARIVRGQILSLREQEFMLATEATGLPVWRRMFRHLLPNVMPQLIVVASLNLGSVILMESTLSFLGIGVKYPFASWGNIANAVTTSYVMTNYLFLWVPAGILILLTVLGFNFVGDGLRDAFDPKSNK